MAWKKALVSGMLCLLLTGCQGEQPPTQKALDLRTGLLNAGGCAFTAAIGADYEDRSYEFTVACTYHADGETVVTVLQPEEIAGIKAVISDHRASLEFEDLALDFGPMANGNVSPMEACRLLADCWTGAYISACGPDGDLERITYLDGYEDDQLTVDTWVDGTVPVYAEVTYEGLRCITMQLTDFTLEEPA